jgi:hypothetical protein
VNILTALFTAGWIGPIITALIMVASGLYINRSARSEAEKAAKEAYEGAIKATKAHVDALQERVKDAESENKRLVAITEMIFELLKARDIYISVQGHMVTIREGKETVVTHIRKEEGA